MRKPSRSQKRADGAMSVESTNAGAEQPADTHYVWIIHGTFNPPEPGTVKWFETGRNGVTTFCDALSERLMGTPLQGAVWRMPHGPTVFAWSGQNDHAERVAAGMKLASEMLEVVKRDPTARVHLVAHSHGGNVVLKAIEHYQEFIQRPPRFRIIPSPDINPSAMAIVQDSPSSDRLGRVVFLGTPFLRKQWIDPYNFFGDFSDRGHRVLAALPYVLLMAYIIGLFADGLFQVLSVWFHGSWPLEILRRVSESVLNYKEIPNDFTFNPTGWPPQVALVVLAFVVWFVIGIFAIDRFCWNTNLYFLRRPGAPSNPAASRIPALVVTARYLDEALIGLSSEPFVYANLAKRIDELLRLPVERTGRRAHHLLGFDNGVRPGYVGPMGWLFQRIVNSGSVVFLVVWKPLRRHCVGPRMTQALLNILNSAACGIPADELRGARLAVLPRLDLPEVFDEEYQDVTDLFLRLPRVSNPNDGRAAIERVNERYAFLQSDDALARKMQTESLDGSGPWAALVASFDKLYSRYTASFELESAAAPAVARMSRAEFEAETARAWFTILERAKEASGAIDLNHSLYQSNPAVVDMVAHFLTTGKALSTGEVFAST